MKKLCVAGGCFWGVGEYYRRLKGIYQSRVGYAQGIVDNPTYQQVCSQTTQHAEAVLLEYDETVISLEQLCEHLFRIIDPTSLNKQGNDRGTQYRTGIYYLTDDDRDVIDKFVNEKQKEYKQPIVVEVEKLVCFYPAEEYHQEYLVKNPTGYCHVDFSVIKETELK